MLRKNNILCDSVKNVTPHNIICASLNHLDEYTN